MSFPDRPDDAVEWAEDPASLTDEPNAERTRGWPFQYIPPADQKNWLQRMVGRWLDYLRKSAGGGFDRLGDLIDTLEIGEAAALVTPNSLPKTSTKADSLYRLLSIDCDGRDIYWIGDDTTPLIGGTRFAGGTFDDFSPIALNDADLTQPVTVETNGAAVVVGYTTTGAPTTAKIIVFEPGLEGGSTRWVEEYTDATDVSHADLAVSGDCVYHTIATGGTFTDSFKLDLTDGSRSAIYSEAGAIVRATNGQFVGMAIDSDTFALFDTDLNKIWEHVHGATTEVAYATMNEHSAYVATGDNDLLVYSASPANIDPKTIGLDYGRVWVDVDHVISIPDGSAATISIPSESLSVLGPVWSFLTDDIDLTFPIDGFATDGRFVYIAGSVDGGDYALWIVDKAARPRIWRRLDPDDNDSWTRTLAAPI